MIKANKGTVELDGKVYQLLGELGTIVHGIYYIMTEKQARAPKDARRMIGRAVKMGLDLENDAIKKCRRERRVGKRARIRRRAFRAVGADSGLVKGGQGCKGLRLTA